jgi:hypothetical protein
MLGMHPHTRTHTHAHVHTVTAHDRRASTNPAANPPEEGMLYLSTLDTCATRSIIVQSEPSKDKRTLVQRVCRSSASTCPETRCVRATEECLRYRNTHANAFSKCSSNQSTPHLAVIVGVEHGERVLLDFVPLHIHIAVVCGNLCRVSNVG